MMALPSSASAMIALRIMICPYQSYRRFTPSIFSFCFFPAPHITEYSHPTRSERKERPKKKKEKRKKKGED
jgi:hypothetical protein